MELKNLRVAVVPTEMTDNGIDQSSSVAEILACEETVLYPITDYFKAQNDEDLPMHWSFLIDISTNEDLTGANIDGIHMHTRKSQIAEIKSIIDEYGSTSTSELELESSPCISSIGNGKYNVSELVESFFSDRVEVAIYHDDTELDRYMVMYEDLSDDLIYEIWHIILDYKTDMLNEE